MHLVIKFLALNKQKWKVLLSKYKNNLNLYPYFKGVFINKKKISLSLNLKSQIQKKMLHNSLSPLKNFKKIQIIIKDVAYHLNFNEIHLLMNFPALIEVLVINTHKSLESNENSGNKKNHNKCRITYSKGSFPAKRVTTILTIHTVRKTTNNSMKEQKITLLNTISRKTIHKVSIAQNHFYLIIKVTATQTHPAMPDRVLAKTTQIDTHHRFLDVEGKDKS